MAVAAADAFEIRGPARPDITRLDEPLDVADAGERCRRGAAARPRSATSAATASSRSSIAS